MENAQERSNRNALLQQLADKENIKKVIVATAAILLTNIGKYVLSLDRVGAWFSNVFHVSPSTYLYINQKTIVIVILAIGYGVLLVLTYWKFIARMPSRRRTAYGTLAGIVIISVFLVNVYALPPQPDSTSLIPRKKWSDRIAASLAPNGGIYAKAADPSTPTQVWTTAQALTGMIAGQDLDDAKIQVIRSGFLYIGNARHSGTDNDYHEGWGLFEKSKYSTTEIAAWVAVAHISSLESKIRIWQPDEASSIRKRISRDLELILQRQGSDGGWRPIKQDGLNFTRTYSTATALWSLIEARRSKDLTETGTVGNKYDRQISTGVDWLLRNYTTIKLEGVPKKLGWVPNPNRTGQREQFDGLTAQVLFILSRLEDQPPFDRLKQNAELLDCFSVSQ